jgi:hypothetical protein
MSRYVIKSSNQDLLVTVGFDPPLETFFLQVDSYTAPLEEDVWLGTSPGELPTVEALAEVTRPYATLTAEVRAQLQYDADHRTIPTPLQRSMIRLMQRV